MTMQVGEMMTRDVVTCSPDEALSQVAQKMDSRNIGSCPVVENDRLIGIITDRDITTRAVANGLDPGLTHVRQVMTTDVIIGNPTMCCHEASQLMSDNQIRRLPIVEYDRMVGIVSLANLAIDLEEEHLVAETLVKISQPSC